MIRRTEIYKCKSGELFELADTEGWWRWYWLRSSTEALLRCVSFFFSSSSSSLVSWCAAEAHHCFLQEVWILLTIFRRRNKKRLFFLTLQCNLYYLLPLNMVLEGLSYVLSILNDISFSISATFSLSQTHCSVGHQWPWALMQASLLSPQVLSFLSSLTFLLLNALQWP